MANLDVPTFLEIPGAWLLDQQACDELDDIVSKQWEEMSRYRESLVAKETERRYGELIEWSGNSESSSEVKAELRARVKKDAEDSYALTASCSVKVELANKATITAESLRDAQKEPAVRDHQIRSINYDLRAADVRCTIELDDGVLSNRFKLSVVGEDRQLRLGIFNAFEKWTDKHQQPFAIRRWTRVWTSAMWGTAVFAWWIVLTIVMDLSNRSESISKKAARDLLSKGIASPEDERSAIELLLSLASGFNKAALPQPDHTWFWHLTLFAFVVLVALSIVPSHIVIGVGKGKARHTFWKWWLKLIGVTIPLAFVGAVIATAKNQLWAVASSDIGAK
jgi:hypothetical protein